MKSTRPVSLRQAALQIVRTLRDAEHTALFAGGCVRDQLLGRRPDDYDVATDATPRQIMQLFRRTQSVGAKFGVVIVGVGPHWIEVATFRSDANYADGRHPAQVSFCSADEDAARRDFTINGMFYDPIARRVVDTVGGRADLRVGIVRAIGDPNHRFAEDHLRMLRAIRFASRFGFRIAPATRAAIVRHRASIARISPERLCDELEQILTGPNRLRGWRDLCETGLTLHLWPGSDVLRKHARTIGARLAALPVTVTFELALAAVLVPLSTPEVSQTCRALRTSNRTRERVVWLHRHLGDLADPDKLTLADLKLLMNGPCFSDLLHLFAADLNALRRADGPHRRIARRAAAVAQSAVAPPPLLTGNDLARMNVPQGPIYRTILDRVYYEQLNETISNRAAARALARRLLNSPST